MATLLLFILFFIFCCLGIHALSLWRNSEEKLFVHWKENSTHECPVISFVCMRKASLLMLQNWPSTFKYSKSSVPEKCCFTGEFPTTNKYSMCLFLYEWVTSTWSSPGGCYSNEHASHACPARQENTMRGFLNVALACGTCTKRCNCSWTWARPGDQARIL